MAIKIDARWLVDPKHASWIHLSQRGVSTQVGVVPTQNYILIDIDINQLPSSENVNDWSGDKYANTLRHVQDHSEFNQHFRQLLHIAFKLAAKEGVRYTNLLKSNAEIVGKNVTENLYDRHFKRIFIW